MSKFTRETKSVFSLSQQYADDTFKKCPICGSKEPLWNTTSKYKGLLKYYLFKCSNCDSILSVSEADMTGLSFTTASMQGQWKKGRGKDSRVIYIHIDEIGLSITDPLIMRLEKKEMPLDTLLEYSEKMYGNENE